MSEFQLTPQPTTSSTHCYNRKKSNPYNDKLNDFQEFVLQDHAAEQFKNNWLATVFKNQERLNVEIGVGYGDFMADYCQKNPQDNFVGLDIRFRRSLSVAKNLAQIPHRQFRFCRATGERLAEIFGPQEIDQMFYFFPDPWPKKKHHKKRLFKATYLSQIAPLFKSNGHIFVKTDHLELYHWMMDQLTVQTQWNLKFNTTDLYQECENNNCEMMQLIEPLINFQTKFEKIFLEQKSPIKAFVLCRK